MTPKSTSGPAFLGRLFWLMVGPAILFLIAVKIIVNGSGWSSRKSIAFLLVLPSLILGRLLEFRGGDPRTADDKPASQQHLRRYAVLSLIIGTVLWAIVNFVGTLLATD